MIILEEYLNYLNEVSKWKKEVNKLSDKNIEKIKQAKVAKSVEEFRKGVDKGTKNIIKKSGATFKRRIPISINAKFHSRPGILTKKQTVNSPISWSGGSDAKYIGVKNRAQWKAERPYIERHEADEARYSNKSRKKYGTKLGSKEIYKVTPSGDRIKVGHHQSIGVLKKEKELTDFANKVYGDAPKLRAFRKSSGEDELAKKLSYKQINKMDKESAKKAISGLRKKMLDAYKGDRKAAAAGLKQLLKTRKFIGKYGKPGLAAAGIATAAGIGTAGYRSFANKKKYK